MNNENMIPFNDELKKLREIDADVATLLDTFGEIQQVYSEIAEFMGTANNFSQEVKNSADITISLPPNPYSK